MAKYRLGTPQNPDYGINTGPITDDYVSWATGIAAGIRRAKTKEEVNKLAEVMKGFRRVGQADSQLPAEAKRIIQEAASNQIERIDANYKNAPWGVNPGQEGSQEASEAEKQDALWQLTKYGPGGDASRPGKYGDKLQGYEITQAEYDRAVAPWITSQASGEAQLRQDDANAMQGRELDAARRGTILVTQKHLDAAPDDAELKKTYDYQQAETQKNEALKTDNASGSGAPVYSVDKSPEMLEVEKLIKARLVQPKELPDLTAKWNDYLNKMNAPFEEQASERLRAEFSAASPLSYGSGSQMEATKNLVREQEANKAAQALSLGQTEYQTQKSDYENALNMALGLAEYYDNASKMRTDQERQDYWNTTSRKWQLEDVASGRAYEQKNQVTARNQQLEDQKAADDQYWKRLMATQGFALSAQEAADKKQMELLLKQRGWQLEDALTARNQALEDYAMEKADYTKIAADNRPKDVPWWQSLLAPVAQGFGYAAGGPAGGAAAKWMASFFGNQEDTMNTYTGIGNNVPTLQS